MVHSTPSINWVYSLYQQHDFPKSLYMTCLCMYKYLKENICQWTWVVLYVQQLLATVGSHSDVLAEELVKGTGIHFIRILGTAGRNWEMVLITDPWIPFCISGGTKGFCGSDLTDFKDKILQPKCWYQMIEFSSSWVSF